ncbi:Methylenetetrahydrofolate dehydrogenase / Methenyltetrahydrofolate cyclohydrolase [Bosea sp. 62]|uniref:bifunctional 5,10-methylenetetrahydrofolate dehydrogenase/5,10-methenyltetrahydrofolate cyclohydrolase n=1 Tax=unclassified Bosea (in: a-proteobacteria) TaxID=2653178 RepID=UPI001251D0F0|nr:MULTISPECIES: tetrahydrofolate dehydrogenase/cyclohydrolase catalytic domain-containing protein [unclassified Bosea (in: a-proteobacteria)]CAD5249180.1 Methylenetetrahydrofolate dehydrogenase / Methenyltetrahydrofolate cyclohydrolase [Bosea sp. 46]CAD5250169.1 Methylenetetrahydrofolate dehydrogenase / Methenyltetrahydrofolate cyclohydrolase [Bosea sp. 21B]CAD5265459.1 Methylenetetrahydrofolate dehydrogenase / Methenyltetrahydrofolate cyclohydrolase [Bosea sp. 7B]VVT44511.1 Methylenetetrahydr
MSARILDGREIARDIRAETALRIAGLTTRTGIVPHLVVILVGENAASRVYVENKVRACAEVGIKSTLIRFDAGISAQELICEIERLNRSPDVHGILVQLPLPPHHDIQAVLRTISIHKDVDGFHLYNVGGLVVGKTIFSPCTPYGVMRMLDHAAIPVEGRNVTIVGASNIVGKPMALMMMARDATVSVCHAKTRDLAQYTILADILVVAAGVPKFIGAQMVRTGAVVIDVGINRDPQGKLQGDVDFDAVRAKASYITPVPGGVGPMTVTMLLVNTVSAAERIAASASMHSLRQSDLAADLSVEVG